MEAWVLGCKLSLATRPLSKACPAGRKATAVRVFLTCRILASKEIGILASKEIVISLLARMQLLFKMAFSLLTGSPLVALSKETINFNKSCILLGVPERSLASSQISPRRSLES